MTVVPMCAASTPLADESPPTKSGEVPFAAVYVTITKQEHIQLKSDALKVADFASQSGWTLQMAGAALPTNPARTQSAATKIQAKLQGELEAAQAPD